MLILRGGGDRAACPDGGTQFFQNAGCVDKKRREYADSYHEPFDDLNYQDVFVDLEEMDLEEWVERHLLSYLGTLP